LLLLPPFHTPQMKLQYLHWRHQQYQPSSSDTHTDCHLFIIQTKKSIWALVKTPNVTFLLRITHSSSIVIMAIVSRILKTILVLVLHWWTCWLGSCWIYCW
jgi:hypothetical protein